MLELLLAVLVWLMRGLGFYVAILIVLLSAAFALTGVWVLLEQGALWVVRAFRRWRVARELDQQATEDRLRLTALTGTKDLPPSRGPKRVA